MVWLYEFVTYPVITAAVPAQIVITADKPQYSNNNSSDRVQSLLFDSAKGDAARADGPEGSFSELPEAGSNVRLHQLHPPLLLLTPQVTLPHSYDRLPVWG